MTRRHIAVLSCALLLTAWTGPIFAEETCQVSIYYALRHERAPEYSHMSDMRYAVMTQQKVAKARKSGKIRSKLVGRTLRHFPEYRDLPADELIDVIETETIHAIACFESRG